MIKLPRLDVPTYELNLISNGQTVRYRPFLVKEQKLFLMSAESEDTKELVTTIRSVLKNCLLDEIDVDSLPSFDLEYLFMNLRARSVEEVVNLKYKCNNNGVCWEFGIASHHHTVSDSGRNRPPHPHPHPHRTRNDH